MDAEVEGRLMYWVRVKLLVSAAGLADLAARRRSLLSIATSSGFVSSSSSMVRSSNCESVSSRVSPPHS